MHHRLGQRRRTLRLAGQQGLLAALHRPKQGLQPAKIHVLIHAIAEGLGEQRMIRKLAHALDVLQTGRRFREDQGEQIVAAHADKQGRKTTLTPAPRHCQGTRGVPAPANLEHGCIEQGLPQDHLDAVGMQKSEDALQRKAMRRPQREQQRIFQRRGLQLEVELRAKALAQSQSPGSI